MGLIRKAMSVSSLGAVKYTSKREAQTKKAIAEARLAVHPARPGCVLCGAVDYPLSTGGPTICCLCDCSPPEMRVRQLAEENRQLRALLTELEATPRLVPVDEAKDVW